MSGTGHATRQVAPSGGMRIDGLLAETAWDHGVIAYALPEDPLLYTGAAGSYGAGEAESLRAPTDTLRDAVGAALDPAHGTAADDGFAVGGFTALELTATTLPGAHVRVALTSSDPYGYKTAWTYLPGPFEASGDVWLSDVSHDYSVPQAGGYAHLVLLHELGHALGLKHGQSELGFGALPAPVDAMEFSVMTYRSYVGAPGVAWNNETWGYAQSYMMLDIAALQYLYGANYAANAGDTVYSWTPDSGETRVDGAVAIAPGGNRIFATIWDGGGCDTYDLSAYSTPVQIDLAPGASSLFSTDQLASLGHGMRAGGNIYNALLHAGDPRARIENARGGAGDDLLRGNAGDNRLEGNAGTDSLFGLSGDDLLLGGGGSDLLTGGSGHDTLRGNRGSDTLLGNNGNDMLFGGKGDDRLEGGSGADWLTGHRADDMLKGGSGRDLLRGGAGDDWLEGGAGADLLIGGSGRDRFVFTRLGDSAPGRARDEIGDFTPGRDLIDLSPLSVAPLSMGFGRRHSGDAPELLLHETALGTRLGLDADGDGKTDMVIFVAGRTGLSAEDFLV